MTSCCIMKAGFADGQSLQRVFTMRRGGKSGLHRAACRLTAGGTRSKRVSRKVPQKIYRCRLGPRVRIGGKGEKVRQERTAGEAIRLAGQTPCGARPNRRGGAARSVRLS